MEFTVSQLRRQLDSITKYLSPLLPVANCHMVEFFTNNHWDNLLPNKLRDSLESLELQCILENFWNSAGYNSLGTTSALQDWISKAKAHCVTANNTYCITEEQFRDRIKEWGGDIKPGTYAKEFMTPKKRYEISTMAPLASAVCAARDVTLCIEAGGGRGPLLRALSAAHAQPALTLDCSPALLRAARGVEQKQSKSTKKPNNNGEGDMSENLHRYAHAYVTSHTNMAEIARDIFPELFIDGQDTKLLLTGLHTCGNLGPDSIRIFVDQSPVKGIFNVPCCYHLLTEEIDVDMFDVFQKNYSNNARIPTTGFPMSEHLRGYNLGRNARMLAAQSIDRVVSLRQLPAKSLLYRALLQVIIKDHVPNQPLSEGKLKRVSPKCGNFKQYFQRADEILNLNLFDRLTDSYLTDICHNIDSQWKKLVTFYLVRLCLAQVVESVILLDRLLFLFENGFYNVYLVKLFDPVLSPRCHSIVAIK